MSRRSLNLPPDAGLYVQRAKRNGICPACGRFIRARRSSIAPFPVPLPLTLDAIYHNGREWRSRTSPDDAPLFPMEPREWGHERCVRRYLRRTSGQDHGDIADARRKALEDHKRAAMGHGATGSRRGGGA